MKKIISAVCLLGILNNVPAQTISYDLSGIPENIKKDASLITQTEDNLLTIEDENKASYKYHSIYTVVNEEGKKGLLIYQYLTKYISLEDLEVKVYDAKGKQTARYKKKDMTLQATGEGLIEDGFYSYLVLSAPSYPITIDLTYEVKYKGTIFLPDYDILNPGESIVKSSFTAKVPPELGFRYHSKNIDLKPDIKDEGKYTLYTWQVNNLPPFEYEQGAVNISDRYPQVSYVVNKFSYFGNEGDLSSWNSFGQWINKLYAGLDVLSPTRAEFFKSLVKDAQTDRDKAKIIYQYLQDNFRYVSIQLGVGGLKPFSAEFTDQKKYGDCKALSNFMKAALEAVGVKSHIAIINAEYNSLPVDPGFPANDFDHVILCIPQPGDSIWLECTSNTADFGELGTFTENRNALLITEKGGVLVPTPRSAARANFFSASTVMNLFEDASGTSETIFTGSGYYKEMLNFILKEKKDEQKESIVYTLGFKQPDDFAWNKKSETGQLVTSLKLETEKIPEFTAGNKWFISPRPYKIWSITLPKSENRKMDYYFQTPFIRTDTTQYRLPEGFASDVLPKPRELKCSYASYKTNYWYDEKNRSVYSTTTLELDQHKIPVEKYAEVKSFFDDVLKDDTQKIVVKKL